MSLLNYESDWYFGSNLTLYFFCSPTEAVSAFSWEPGGSKFAIIHGESPRISASFYDMEKQGSVSLLSK